MINCLLKGRKSKQKELTGAVAAVVVGSTRANLATRESGHITEKLVVVGENGVKRRGPGALVPRPSRLCGTFPNVQPAQNPALCALSPGGVSV